MSLPAQREIKIPLLNLIYNLGGSAKPQDCYLPLANYFNLTPEDLQKTLNDKKNLEWNNLVQWARQHLVNDGYLYNPEVSKRGVWQITPLGKIEVKKINESEFLYPEEVSVLFFEGDKKQITINAYERNKEARNKCIDYYGYKCSVCNLEFEEKYGDIGKDFIHVHHIIPISQVNKKYKIDPIKDLRPVCPNCHAMIHKREIPFSIKEMKEKLIKK